VKVKGVSILYSFINRIIIVDQIPLPLPYYRILYFEDITNVPCEPASDTPPVKYSITTNVILQFQITMKREISHTPDITSSSTSTSSPSPKKPKLTPIKKDDTKSTFTPSGGGWEAEKKEELMSKIFAAGGCGRGRWTCQRSESIYHQ
jgi:hypothetical protein